MIAAQAALWGKAAAATASDLGKRAGSLAAEGVRRTVVAAKQARTAALDSAGRIALHLGKARKKFSTRARAQTTAFRTAVAEQRHGTWLILFGLLFTLLWLGADWIGIANGLWRGLLIGIATPLIVNALYPLKRRR
jgi:hypothetical protein